MLGETAGVETAGKSAQRKHTEHSCECHGNPAHQREPLPKIPRVSHAIIFMDLLVLMHSSQSSLPNLCAFVSLS